MDFTEYFPRYYTPAGQPTDPDGVAAETMRRGGPTVAQTMVIDTADPARNVAVSTTYTGLGRLAPGRPPLIFTSHALLNDGTGLSEVSENHYPTESLAREGHADGRGDRGHHDRPRGHRRPTSASTGLRDLGRAVHGEHRTQDRPL